MDPIFENLVGVSATPLPASRKWGGGLAHYVNWVEVDQSDFREH